MSDLLSTLHDTFDFWRFEHSPNQRLTFIGRPRVCEWTYVHAHQRPGERLDDFILRVTSDAARLARGNEVDNRR